MRMDTQKIQVLDQVLTRYDLPGELVQAVPCVTGHINDTYRVILQHGKETEEYFIQRINDYVFKEPVKVMHNIQAVNRHTACRKTAEDCDIISFLPSRDGTNYAVVDGNYWRISRGVRNAVVFDVVENSQILYSTGYAFGRFQAMLADLPMDTLYETIPDFHNTRKRLKDFFNAAAQDPLGRSATVSEDIRFFEEHQKLACTLCDLQAQGELPLRVTHNDTKYNNILMDKDTLQPLCVIDLDTVMPGLSMMDFGDAIRFAANTAVEDEQDLTKVGFNIEHYRAFAKGFMNASQGAFTANEVEHMALGAVVITIELASRFLMDHINGDKYFRIHRPDHNLDRARCQIKLAQDMLDNYAEMVRIVKEFA